MKVAVIKYNAGNVFSVECALRRIGVEPVVTDDEAAIMAADKVVFPGVGEASSAMAYLRERRMDETIRRLTRPVLGVCIGQQLLCRHSEEGDADCIGVFDADVARFADTGAGLKIPQMGWNTIEAANGGCELLRGVADGSYVYYVHSYYVPVCQWTVATTDYAAPFSAMMRKDNFFATQFHPEKSGSVGERILRNFIEL